MFSPWKKRGSLGWQLVSSRVMTHTYTHTCMYIKDQGRWFYRILVSESIITHVDRESWTKGSSLEVIFLGSEGFVSQLKSWPHPFQVLLGRCRIGLYDLVSDPSTGLTRFRSRRVLRTGTGHWGVSRKHARVTSTSGSTGSLRQIEQARTLEGGFSRL